MVSDTKLEALDVLLMILVITGWFLEKMRCVKPKQRLSSDSALCKDEGLS